MKKITMAVLGFGQRGKLYADIALLENQLVELVAVCDRNQDKVSMLIDKYKVKAEMIFNTDTAFFAKGKLADMLVIATLDDAHYPQVIKALDLGYHILLEKPIALKKEQIYEIKNKANKLGLKIAVAHVLRYTPFYQMIKKIIIDGTIGKVATINQTENIGYFHYAHSYVRGNWHKTPESAPIIMAKSVHDLDILCYLVDARVKRLSSFGNLFYFKKENAPPESTENCLDCQVDCPFNAVKFYQANPKWFNLFSQEVDIKAYFKNNNSNYGKCVYKMDNNVADHQVVSLDFENGVSGVFLMTGFSNENHRKLTVHGTLGEIDADMDDGIITVKPYGKGKQVINTKDSIDKISPHAGGDSRFFIDFVKALIDETDFITNINYSVESHVLAFTAEASKNNNGLVHDLTEEWPNYGY
jgi:predicted dehydrogenase